MAEDKYIKLHDGSEISDIKFNNYYVKNGNQFTSFKSIVPKDKAKGVEGEWEYNDDCVVEIISNRKLAIKKFKIDAWIIRRRTGSSGSEYNNFGNNFKIKVSGLDYVHNNVVYHLNENGEKVYGFTEAYVGGGSGEQTGYNDIWYPGCKIKWENNGITSNKYVKGLLIQGYNWSSSVSDNMYYHMGRAPWDIGKYTFITDGFVGTKAWRGVGNYGYCIGLFGGDQTATSYLDNSNGAYRVYDISEHPIIIDLDVEDVSTLLDPSSIECWDIYLGEQQVYKRNRTVENCWLKYGFLTNEYYYNLYGNKISLGENSKLYTLVNKCEEFINEPKQRKIFTPIASDWKKLFMPKYIALNGTFDEVNKVSSDLKNPNIDAVYYQKLGDNSYQTYVCTNKTWENSEIKDSEATYTILILRQQYYSKQIKNGTKVYVLHTYNSDTNIFESSEINEIPSGAIELNSNASYVVNDVQYYLNIVYTLEKSDIIDSVSQKGIRWQCKNYNTKLWDDVKDFYAEYKIPDSILLDCAFRNSNIDGELTLNLDYDYGFGSAHCLIEGTNVTNVNFIVHNNDCGITSMNRMFRGAKNLSGVTVTNLVNQNKCLCGAYDMSGAFEQGCALKTYPSNLINWGNRANFQTALRGTTNLGYMFDGTNAIESLPISSAAIGDRFNDSNTIIPNAAVQTFNGCSNITYIGPVIDAAYLKPNEQKFMFKGCSKLSDLRLKRINHGDWRLDGTTYSNSNFIGNLVSLDEESISYLLTNAYDLTNADTTKGIETANNTFKLWYYNNGKIEINTNIGNASYASCYFTYGYFRLQAITSGVEDLVEPQDNGEFLISTTNQLENMKINVSGLQSSYWLWFGKSDFSDGIVISKNGNATLNKSNTDKWGLILFTTMSENKGYLVGPSVSISITDPCDQTIPSIKTANLYCPASWEDKIKNDDIISINNKGWTVYVGGIEKVVNS